MALIIKKPKHPMGERKKDEYRVKFSKKIKLLFQGTQLSSNGGLLLYRDLDTSLGMTKMISDKLVDHRTGKNICHPVLSLLRQSIYSRLAGYEDVNGANVTMADPVFRYSIGGKAIDRLAASTSEMHAFETQCLSKRNNLKTLHTALGQSVMQSHSKRTRFDCITFDLDSSESKAYGHQQGVLYNGYFQSTCYHPLFCFNHFGDLEGIRLRCGNAHSAQDWEQVLLPVMARYRAQT